MSLVEKKSPEKISVSKLVSDILKDDDFRNKKNSKKTEENTLMIQNQVTSLLENKYSEENLEKLSESQLNKLKEDISLSIKYILSQKHEEWNEGTWTEELNNIFEINKKFSNQIDLKKVLEILGKKEKNSLAYYLQKIGTREFKEIGESIGWKQLIKEVKKEKSKVLDIYLTIPKKIKKSIIQDLGLKKLFKIFNEFEKINFFEFFKIPDKNLEILISNWGWNNLLKGFNPLLNSFLVTDNIQIIQFFQRISPQDLEEIGNILGWKTFRKKLFNSRSEIHRYPLRNRKNQELIIEKIGKNNFIKLFSKRDVYYFFSFLEQCEINTLAFFIDHMGIENLISITRNTGFNLMHNIHNIKPETAELLLKHNFNYEEARKEISKKNSKENKNTDKNESKSKKNKTTKYSELSIIEKLRQNKERKNIFNKINNDHRIASINFISAHLENLKFFSQYPILLDEILADPFKATILRKNPEITKNFFQDKSESEIRIFINKTGNQIENATNSIILLSNILGNNQNDLIWYIITKKFKNSKKNYQILQDALGLISNEKNQNLKQWVIFILKNRKNKSLEYLSLIGEFFIFGVPKDKINCIGEIFLPLENKEDETLENLFKTDKNKKTKFEKALFIFLRENKLQLDEKKQRQIQNNLNQLKNKKSNFNQAALKSLTKILEPEILEYFKKIRNKQIEKSLKMPAESINLNNLPHHFIIFYKMVLSTRLNKIQGLKLIQKYLKKSCYIDEENTKNIFETYPYSEEVNKESIQENFPNKKKRKFWFRPNKKEFIIQQTDSTEDISKKRIQQHIAVIDNIFKNYTDIPDLKNPKTILDDWTKHQETLEKKLKNEDFMDLKLQINAIKKIKENKNTKKIEKITIERELDPSKIAMMGEWVDGSCLAYGGINYFSAISNALDANKAVFYIKDENGNILGRVLCAIPKKGKLIRFPLYQKGNTNVDLDKYFNQYIEEVAKDSGLKPTNMPLKYSVRDLVSERWYRDPQGNFKT